MHQDSTIPPFNSNPQETKRCSKCQQQVPLSYFDRDRRRRDGRKGSCKQCLRPLKKKYREDNKERIAENDRRYYQAHRDKIVKWNRQYKRENRDREAEYARRYYLANKDRIEKRKQQYQSENKVKIARQKRQYEQANKDKIAARRLRYRQLNPGKIASMSRRWQRSNPEKVREYKRNRRALIAGNGGSVTVAEWQSVLGHFKGRCAKCGSHEDIHMDHVVPLSKGGAHSVDNIQPLCASCNLSKYTKTEDYRGKMYRPLTLPLDNDT